MEKIDTLHKSLFRILLLLLLTGIVPLSSVVASDTASIVILSSRKVLPYKQLEAAFKAELLENSSKIDVSSFLLSKKNMQDNGDLLKEIRQLKPLLILALGTRAIQTSLAEFPDTPLVASMVVNKEALAQSSQATGILLSFSPEIHFQWLRRFLPGHKRVAILYSLKENQKWIQDAKKDALRFGLQIDAIDIDSVKHLPQALKGLSRRADVLLGIPDTTVYSAKTAKMILLSCFRNKIPFVGLSQAWVKAGALYGLDWDYREVGRQCGFVAGQILDGVSPASIPTRSLGDHILFSVNMRTVNHMNLKIDSALLSSASKIFE